MTSKEHFELAHHALIFGDLVIARHNLDALCALDATGIHFEVENYPVLASLPEPMRVVYTERMEIINARYDD